MEATGERLPWLNDEPGTGSPGRRVSPTRPPSRGMWPWYAALLLLIVGVGGGLWWLGTRQQDAPPPELAQESSPSLPIARIEPMIEVQPPVEIAPGKMVETSAPRVVRSGPVRGPDTRPAPVARGSHEPIEKAADAPNGRSVFPADESPAAPPPLTGPRPVVVYHPQPNRGRVVQLGAYATRVQAEEIWRKVTRRYPYLASKPKMVNSVDVRALGGGRRTRMYRLQLGTSSQAQSAVICQQLEKAGQSCVVVY